MRVAIVHDYLTQRGGAERVVLALHEMFPDAPIYTSLYDPEDTFEGFAGADIRSSALQHLPHKGDRFRAYLPVYARVFERMKVHGYDLVVSSSSGWAHAVDTNGAVHVCYCHAPAKWLYRTADYAGRTGGMKVAAVAPMLKWLRRWDARAARRPDVYVANSSMISRQVLDVYGRLAPVVHPPVDVERFPSQDSKPSADAPYLVVARLLPYKRIDLAVRACTTIGAPLVVVGDGPAMEDLARIAGPTVRFAGRLGEDELRQTFMSCRALLQPGTEDFGIVPIEANAAGRPVIAYAGGGARDTVAHGRTGVLFAEQSEEALIEAMRRLESLAWEPAQMRAHAERFSTSVFERKMRALIADAMRAKQGARTAEAAGAGEVAHR